MFPHPPCPCMQHVCKVKEIKDFFSMAKTPLQSIFIIFVSIPHLPLSLFAADANPKEILITVP